MTIYSRKVTDPAENSETQKEYNARKWREYLLNHTGENGFEGINYDPEKARRHLIELLETVRRTGCRIK